MRVTWIGIVSPFDVLSNYFNNLLLLWALNFTFPEGIKYEEPHVDDGREGGGGMVIKFPRITLVSLYPSV